jgi:hypothetical protein
LEYFSDTTLVIDTFNIKNGKFGFTGEIAEPSRASLYDRKYSELAHIYIKPKEMIISVFKDKPLGSKIIGSKKQTEYDTLNKREELIYERLTELRRERSLINDNLKDSLNTNVKLLLEKSIEVIDSLYSTTRDKLYPIELKFVLENPKSFVTLDYLRMFGSNEVISLDSLVPIFNGLDNSLPEVNMLNISLSL